LDEVDAALDLSHTQNIGQMLRTHFNQSQFIVVSLKDGMFNNANVLFKTKFVDGLSTVRRFTQQQPERPDEDEAAPAAAAGGGSRGSKSAAGKPKARALADAN
jgi:structural maintenance of chromosome 2